MGGFNMKNILFILCNCLCCASYADTPPNIRIIEGIDLCQPMCDKLIALDKKNGNEDCLPYYEDITVDGKVYSCVDFCKTMMSQSIDLKTECILNQVENCSVDMNVKCEL